MADISRATSFGKLNPILYKAIEGATVFAKLRGNPYVELPRGATSLSDLSDHIDSAVERGWVYGTLMFNDAQVRGGYLMVGLLKTPSLRNALLAISRQFERVKPEALADSLAQIVSGSPEDRLASSDGASAGAAPGEASGAMSPAQMGKQEALKKFTVDMTENARKGGMDPITGRDEERPGWERPPWSRALRSAWPKATCRLSSRTCRCSAWTSGCCRPAPA